MSLLTDFLPQGSTTPAMAGEIGSINLSPVYANTLESGKLVRMDGSVLSRSSYSALSAVWPANYTISWDEKTSSFSSTNINSVDNDRINDDINAALENNTGASWVAVGDSGKIAYSVDGQTWTQVSSSPFGASNVNDIVFNHNGDTSSRWIAVGNDGKIYYSSTTDIETWNAGSTSFGATHINAIYPFKHPQTYSTIIVAVGDSGKLETSPTGVTWTARTSQFGASNINGIVSGFGDDDILVAVGNDGKISTSTNGTTWTARTSQFSTSHIYDIAYGFEKFVAVGQAGKISTSEDGITWVAQTTPISNDLNSVVFVDNMFVASYNNNILWSSDGVTWNTNTDTSSIFTNINGLGTDGDNVVAVGDSGKLATGDVSVFDLIWAKYDTLESTAPQTTDIRGVSYSSDHGAWVAVGSNGVIYYSHDANSWNRVASFTGANFFCVHYDNNIWVAGSQQNRIYTSPDGITWAERSTPYGTSGAVNTVFFGNGKWLGGGYDGANGYVMESTDAITWTDVTGWTSTETVETLHYGNGTWVAGGSNLALYISTNDGGSWTDKTPTLPDSTFTQFNAAFYDGTSRWVVVGPDLEYVTSTDDGTTWTVRDVSWSTTYPWALVYINGIWVGAGVNGSIKMSTDGLHWSEETISDEQFHGINVDDNGRIIASSKINEVYYGFYAHNPSTEMFLPELSITSDDGYSLYAYLRVANS